MSLKDNEFDFSIIRSLRLKEGLTLEEMVQKTGLTQSTILRLEKNRCNPTANTLARIGRVLRRPPSELVKLAQGVHIVQKKAVCTDFPVPNTRKVLFSNAVIHLVDRPRGSISVSPPSIHADAHEIFCLKKGRIRLRVHDKDFELREGDAILFDALFTHSVEVLEDCFYVVVQISEKVKRRF